VAILDGEYGQPDLAMGVPCILDEAGLAAVVELPLDQTEMAQFRQSAETVRGDIARLK
jgi:malate dehydrogenase